MFPLDWMNNPILAMEVVLDDRRIANVSTRHIWLDGTVNIPCTVADVPLVDELRFSGSHTTKSFRRIIRYRNNLTVTNE